MIFETKNILFICPLWGQFLMKCFNNACFPSLSHPQPDALMLCVLASFLRIACCMPELSHLSPPLPMDTQPSSPSRASHHIRKSGKYFFVLFLTFFYFFYTFFTFLQKSTKK